MTVEKCCRYIDHLMKVNSKIIEVNEEATGFEVNSLFLYYACVFFCCYNEDYATLRRQERRNLMRQPPTFMLILLAVRR